MELTQLPTSITLQRDQSLDTPPGHLQATWSIPDAAFMDSAERPYWTTDRHMTEEAALTWAATVVAERSGGVYNVKSWWRSGEGTYAARGAYTTHVLRFTTGTATRPCLTYATATEAENQLQLLRDGEQLVELASRGTDTRRFLPLSAIQEIEYHVNVVALR